MRLTELEPHWVSICRWDDSNGTQHYYDNPPRIGGISFNCPIHTKKCNCCNQFLPSTHRLVVWFKNPIDGLPPQFTKYLWDRKGENFENLTLFPSINASNFVDKETGVVCWHGFITNGEVT